MPEVNLIDRSFNRESTGNYDLSLQVERSGLELAILDNRSGSFVVFRKYRFEHVYHTGDLIRQIIAVFDRDDLLGLPFHAVHFMNYTQQATLVPVHYFLPGHLSDYIRFNLGGEPDGECLSNIIHPIESYCVFSLPKALVSMITLHFRKVEILCQATPFLWNATHQPGSMNSTAIHVGLNTDFFDVAIVGNGKLLLYNTFQYVNETDLLYYVLYVCKQLSLNTRDVPLTLSGELSSRLANIDILKTYLPDIRNAGAPSIPRLSPGLLSIVPHKYLNLFNLHACVLSAENIKAG